LIESDYAKQLNVTVKTSESTQPAKKALPTSTPALALSLESTLGLLPKVETHLV